MLTIGLLCFISLPPSSPPRSAHGMPSGTSCTDTWDATNPEARPRWAAAGREGAAEVEL